MVLHGDAREDELFAEDLIERLEAVNLKGKILLTASKFLNQYSILNSSQVMIYNK